MDQDDIDVIKFNEQVEVHHENSMQEVSFLRNQETDTTERDLLELKRTLADNILGCDFTICLLQAAVRSYRSDSCLRPFPQCFILKNNEKDFVSLKFACDNIPALKDVVNAPQYLIPKETTNLLTWLFNKKTYPYLEPCSIKNIPLLKGEDKVSVPQYIFKVCYSMKNEKSWKNRVESSEVFHAYHGSSVDNFYSILKFGLQQHLSNDKVLFGTGIYLSTELSMCMNYALFAKTWDNSLLGNKHSVIALCEVIKDINKVKSKDNHQTISSNLTAIPEKYFIVTDSEIVRNSFWLVIFLYFLMLVLVGFFNGPYWQKFSNYFRKQE